VQLLKIVAGPFTFRARLEEERAPKTAAAIRAMLPFKSKLVHCRWSGESTWVPMGETKVGGSAGLAYENHTSHPAPGEMLIHPGGISETEILFPYGSTVFASKAGQLAGNHFATIYEGNDELAAMGHRVLWEGAQEITFTELA